jgi:predicted ATP-dependent endonuclease of OLD family
VKILSVRVKNYKSINDSGEIFLDKGISVIAGKNNSGKTAFLDAVFNSIKGVVPWFADPSKFEVEFKFKIDDIEKEAYPELYKKELFWNSKSTSREYKISLGFYNNSSKRILLYQHNSNVENNWKNLSGQLVTYYNSVIKKSVQEKFIYIKEHRKKLTDQTFQRKDSLEDSGSDLYQFLNTFHTNQTDSFKNIKTLFLNIFDDVKDLELRITEKSHIDVVLLFNGLTEPVSLHECGTGFTYVLIYLCHLVLHEEESIILMFDEPNSYLHPSAEKALYDLTKEYSNNSYLFTSHSPLLLNYPIDKNIYLIKKLKNISTFNPVAEEIKECFLEIGFNNSDYAFADRLLLVEGPTEEACIPLLLEKIGIKNIGYNYRIINFSGGSRYTRKSYNDKLFTEHILEKISFSQIPYIVIIDRDEKSENDLIKLQDKYGDKIFILEKRELENYFLDPEVIYRHLSGKLEQENSPLSVSVLKKMIENIINDTSDNEIHKNNNKACIDSLKGSSALEKIYGHYDISYNKIDDGNKLMEFILEKETDVFSGLQQRLTDFFEK